MKQKSVAPKASKKNALQKKRKAEEVQKEEFVETQKSSKSVE